MIMDWLFMRREGERGLFAPKTLADAVFMDDTKKKTVREAIENIGWQDIKSKPEQYAPAEHSQRWETITGAPDIQGLIAQIAARLPLAGGQLTGELKNKAIRAFRLNSGAGKSVILYKDDNNFNILISDTPDGPNKDVFPFTISLADGYAMMRSGLGVGGGLHANALSLDAPLSVANGGTGANDTANGYFNLARRTDVTNLDEMYQTGIYMTRDGFTGTWPASQNNKWGIMHVLNTGRTNTDGYRVQIWRSITNIGTIWQRYRYEGYGWGRWYKFTGTAD